MFAFPRCCSSSPPHTRSAGLRGSSLLTAATSISEAKSRISIEAHMHCIKYFKQAAFNLYLGNIRGSSDEGLENRRCLFAFILGSCSHIQQHPTPVIVTKDQPAPSICGFLSYKEILSGSSGMRHDGISFLVALDTVKVCCLLYSLNCG